jgi:hypothetical protein
MVSLDMVSNISALTSLTMKEQMMPTVLIVVRFGIHQKIGKLFVACYKQ